MSRAHTCSVVHVFLDELRRVPARAPRGADQRHHVAGQRLRDRHHAHELLEVEDLLRARDGLDLGDMRSGGQIDNLQLIVGAQVIQNRVEQKPVELGLRRG